MIRMAAMTRIDTLPVLLLFRPGHNGKNRSQRSSRTPSWPEPGDRPSLGLPGTPPEGVVDHQNQDRADNCYDQTVNVQSRDPMRSEQAESMTADNTPAGQM